MRDPSEAPKPDATKDAPAAAGPQLTLSFARSSSPAFPIIRRRLDTLASLGSLTITRDDAGREASFELRIERDLVANANLIANLLALVRSWRSTEVSFGGELLDPQQRSLLAARLERVRRCWRRHRDDGPASCRASCRLGCHALHVEPTSDRVGYGDMGLPWFESFDGERAVIDKAALRAQVGGERNALVRLCPFYDARDVAARVDALPDAITADEQEWTTVHDDDGKPVWLWPRDGHVPFGMRTPAELRLDLRIGPRDAAESLGPSRAVPPTRYADVVGQDAAIHAVREMIELPLRRGDLLRQLGVAPQPHGVVLAGPPGTGKTLLARAVAGE